MQRRRRTVGGATDRARRWPPRDGRVPRRDVMLAWSGVLHLYLWAKEDGYRAVPTVGPLFLIQGIVGCVLAVAAVSFRRLLIALAGAVYMAASIGGLYKAIHGGLFEYQETSDAPYVQ